MQHEPPYDGKPCPMCPLDVRSLSAVVHNLAWRLADYERYPESACKLVAKFHDMKRLAENLTLSDDAPEELKRLREAALAACKAETVGELLTHWPALKAASEALSPLTDAHFADRRHAYP